MNTKSSISVVKHKDAYTLYVVGEGRFENSLIIKGFVDDLITCKALTHSTIQIDLSGCYYMDSTFIGTLLSLHLSLIKITKNPLIVLNPSDYCLEHFEEMGLEDKLHIKTTTVVENGERILLNPQLDINKLEKLMHIYDSHKQLSDINDNNKIRFAQLQKVLENQIQTFED